MARTTERDAPRELTVAATGTLGRNSLYGGTLAYSRAVGHIGTAGELRIGVEAGVVVGRSNGVTVVPLLVRIFTRLPFEGLGAFRLGVSLGNLLITSDTPETRWAIAAFGLAGVDVPVASWAAILIEMQAGWTDNALVGRGFVAQPRVGLSFLL